MADLANLSTPLLITVGLLSFVSISLFLAGIVAVARTPVEHLPGGLPRPAWLAICVIQFVGPAAFFILRRRERKLASAEEQQSLAGGTSIIDTLYG